jgi:hypothetical protein
MTKRDDHSGDDRLLEALRHEIAKQELEDYEPTPEELREAEPIARYWRARVAERRRENVLARAAGAVELPSATPSLAERSREWLLGRLAELRELARVLPGGVQLAHRNLDARALDDIPTDEIRSHVADLEAAIAAALPKE